MIELIKSSIKYWQRYSYNYTIEVGPNSTQVPKQILRKRLQCFAKKLARGEKKRFTASVNILNGGGAWRLYCSACTPRWQTAKVVTSHA